MRWMIAAWLLLGPTLASVQTVQAGRWEVTSKVVAFDAPGVPAILQRLAQGRTSTERKPVSAGQGIEALLAPDPKANCTVTSQHIEHGRYRQTLTCSPKTGTSVHESRAGTYSEAGFVGQVTIVTTTQERSIRAVLDQRAERAGS